MTRIFDQIRAIRHEVNELAGELRMHEERRFARLAELVGQLAIHYETLAAWVDKAMDRTRPVMIPPVIPPEPDETPTPHLGMRKR